MPSSHKGAAPAYSKLEEKVELDEEEVTEENVNEQSSFDRATRLHRLMIDPLINGNKIKKLLRLSPNVNLQNDQGQTALMLGISNGLRDLDVISLILDKTDLRLTDKFHNSLLHYCCQYGVVVEEIFNNSNVQARNECEKTPLHNVRNDLVLSQLLRQYSSDQLEYVGDAGSALFTNLQDYCQNPEMLKEKGIVLERLCSGSTGYPVPNDINEIMSFAIDKASESDFIRNLLTRTLLPFGKDFIDSDNLLHAIRTDDKTIFNAVVENCTSITDVLTENHVILFECIVAAPHCGVDFNKYLLQFITNTVELIDIKDEKKKTLAHYLCSYNRSDSMSSRLEYLRSLDQKILLLPDSSGCFPLAYAIKNRRCEFLKLYKDYFKSLHLATHTSDLLHYAIETKATKVVSYLAETGFPLSTVDGNKRTALHKVAMHIAPAKSTTISLLSQLDQQECGEEEIMSLIDQQDGFGMRAIEYAVIYEKEDLAELLLQRGSIKSTFIEKIIHFLVSEKEREEDELEDLLMMFNVDYPSEPNVSFVKEVLRKKAEFESATQKSLLTEEAHQHVIYNVFVVSRSGNVPLPHHNSTDRVLFHEVPLDKFSFRDVGLMRGLINRRVVLVLSDAVSSDAQLIRALFCVADEHFHLSSNTQEIPLPGRFFHKNTREALEREPPPSAPLEPSLLKEHQNTGLYFLIGERCFTKIYGNQPAREEEKQALGSAGLCLQYYTEQGQKQYAPRITPSSHSVDVKQSQVLLRVMDSSLNVSRYAVPFISQELVERFLLIPRNGGIELPSATLSFSLPPGLGNDVISFDLTSTLPGAQLLKLNCYIYSLLIEIGGYVRRRDGLELELGVLSKAGSLVFSSIADNPSKEAYTSTDPDIPLESLRLLQKSRLTGGSLLLEADMTLLATAVDSTTIKSLDSYFKGMPSFLGQTEIAQQLHRIALSRTAYTVRDFFREGDWTQKDRAIICEHLGVPVAQTYRKIENCWRLNWVEFLIQFIGLLITAAIFVGCHFGGVDLSKYGPAGIAIFPFLIAIIYRIYRSYSHSPDYANLGVRKV